MNYFFPQTKEIKRQMRIKYGEEFLRMNNLKVGDKVTLEFPYEKVYNQPRVGMSRVTFKKEAEGILKLDENGFLYAESLENFSFYQLQTDKKKDYYKHSQRKSIFHFNP